MSPGERFKLVRASQQKTQKEMAAFVGVSYRTWQDYEGDTNAPGGKVMRHLCSLGININWLLTGQGEMHIHNASPGQVPADNTAVRSQHPVFQIISRIYNLEPDNRNECVKLLSLCLTECLEAVCSDSVRMK